MYMSSSLAKQAIDEEIEEDGARSASEMYHEAGMIIIFLRILSHVAVISGT